MQLCQPVTLRPRVTGPGRGYGTGQSQPCTIRSKAWSGRTCREVLRLAAGCASSMMSGIPPTHTNVSTNICIQRIPREVEMVF